MAMPDIDENMVTLILTGVNIFILFLALFYYFYNTGSLFNKSLKNRECGAFTYIYGTLNGKIRSIAGEQEEFQHTLKDYYIKSAYNCCSGGAYKNDYVDTCILKNLLLQGVRCLDFEIYSLNDMPVVATSTSDNYCVKETFNSVDFKNVMEILKTHAFSTPTAPNYRDPIIIHLRIKSGNQIMYDNFAKMLEEYDNLMLGKEYSYENNGKNIGNTQLAPLMGKIMLVVDKTNNTYLESQAFTEYVNLTSNSIFMRAMHFSDIKNTPDINELIEYNKHNMTIGMPNKGANPENPSSTIMREMGIQMPAMRFQQVDVNEEENEVFFDNTGYAFVLKPERLRYVPVTIPAPPKQDPKMSYATRTVESDYYNFNI